MEIYKQLDDRSGQAQALQILGWLFFGDGQLAAAEEAASQAINLQDDSDQYRVCGCHRLLGNIYKSKGETGKAIDHFEIALGIASSFNWHYEQFWNHFSLADLFSNQNRFDQAHAQIERAKLHVANDLFCLGQATDLHAWILFREGRFEEAKSKASSAADVFGKFGAAIDAERCGKILRDIEEKMKTSVASGESDSSGSQ